VAAIEYVGHATVLIEMDGVRVLTDPLLRNRVAHLRRTAPVDPAAAEGVDAVLISHLHFDHVDVPSLQRLGRATALIAPRGAAPFLRRKGFSDVTEVVAGDELPLGALRALVTPADHDPRRLPVGVRAEPVGFVLRGSQSVYFAGDTDVFSGMASIGPLDAALVPIAGWGAALGPGHMDARGAAASLTLLRPRIAIPIHWGTYFPVHTGLRGAPAFVDGPAAEFEAAAAELAPGVEVRVLRPGGTTTL
jgi:L-ascorbate metabolism protein UlaG (beta-lactamase superfamily)